MSTELFNELHLLGTGLLAVLVLYFAWKYVHFQKAYYKLIKFGQSAIDNLNQKNATDMKNAQDVWLTKAANMRNEITRITENLDTIEANYNSTVNELSQLKFDHQTDINSYIETISNLRKALEEAKTGKGLAEDSLAQRERTITNVLAERDECRGKLNAMLVPAENYQLPVVNNDEEDVIDSIPQPSSMFIRDTEFPVNKPKNKPRTRVRNRKKKD